jgi:sigma-54 dependent transcriptional regulator, acetoin dehydrogenase operon transcriptional activator AcoR
MLLNVRKVHQARAELFEMGAVSESLAHVVRPEILASWRRSRAFGAQPGLNTLVYHEDNGATRRLFAAAEPVLRSLAESLSGFHAGVLLADKDANIVQRWVADSSILPDLDRICSTAGFSAPEEAVGTNGIGTVAQLGRPAQIVGPEHFADSLTNFACVGAPIYGPTSRRLEGIITLSCRADAANALLTPLMMSTASDIEHRLLQSTTLDERRILDAYLTARRRNRLVAAIGKDLLIAGPRTTALLDRLVDRNALWELVSDAVSDARDRPSVLRTTDGDEVRFDLVPIREDQRLVGALVELDEAEAPPLRKRPTSVAPPAISLPGDSAAWRTALDVASRIARDALRAVIVGEAGTGKFTVAREMARLQGGREPVVLDCRELRREGALVHAISAAAASEAAIVLLHLEALDDADVLAARSWVDARSVAERPWVLATLTTGDDAEDELSTKHQLLADRFAGAVIALPSLRQRPDDVPSIARDLVTRHARGRDVYLAPDAIRVLTLARWPGNVRELEDVVRVAVASRVGEVRAADLPPEVQRKTVRRSMSLIEQTECDVIVHALHAAAGNKAEAARSIGLSRSTIYRKIRAYGLDRDARYF